MGLLVYGIYDQILLDHINDSMINKSIWIVYDNIHDYYWIIPLWELFSNIIGLLLFLDDQRFIYWMIRPWDHYWDYWFMGCIYLKILSMIGV